MLQIPPAACRGLKALACDIDDTMTLHGKLLAAAYTALENAKRAGLNVVVVTGRPAGWCDHIARMWPVDAVVGENGAFYFKMEKGRLMRRFVQSERVRAENRSKLDRLANTILREVPGTALASDQSYRLCDLAIDYCEDVRTLSRAKVKRIVEIFESHGAQAKVSSIHVNGWFGDYNKLQMTQRCLAEEHKIDVSRHPERCVFLGDSPNDEPMFEFFPHAIGVANVRRFLGDLKHAPAYITRAEGSLGFAEAVNTLLRKRSA